MHSFCKQIRCEHRNKYDYERNYDTVKKWFSFYIKCLKLNKL